MITDFIAGGFKEMLGKSDDYYINKCNSNSKVSRQSTRSGFIETYQVEDKKIVMSYNQYANGDDDYDNELSDITIEELKYD